MFTLRQEGRLVQDLYASLRALLDELEVYQSFVSDIAKIREYHEELTIAIFLTALHPKISTQIRGQILGADSVSLLSSTFSCVLWIFTATLALVPD